jgi:hypothetical protein
MKHLLVRFAVLGLALCMALSAKAQTCADEASLRSTAPGFPSELSFLNTSQEPRGIFWLDPEGRRTSYGIVEPGHGLQQATAADHAWVVTDAQGQCLMVVIAAAEPRAIDVGGSGESGAAVVPPPPGVQTPLGTSAPRPAGSVVPTATVSPVDTFELQGLFRLTPRNDSEKALNNQANERPEVVRVRSDWDSGQWRFEAVPGTAFVRIRNAWKGTYLQDDRGRLRASAASRDDEAAHWHFEAIDGSPFFQMVNRETDRTLVSRRGEAELTDAVERPNEGHWQLVPVEPETSKVVSAPPARARDSARDRAYQDALDNCLERGGYWTGSSCKPYRGVERIADCGRGWVWDSDFRACVWDGDGVDARVCPPWMSGTPPYCQADMSCRGGTLTVSRRGYQNCDCPPGTSLWGDYPNFRCVRSYAGAGAIALPIAAAIVGLAAYQYVRRPGQPKTKAATSITQVKGLQFAPTAPTKGSTLTPATVSVTKQTDRSVLSGSGKTNPSLQGGSAGGTTSLGGGGGPAKGGPVACKEGQSITTGCVCSAPMAVTVGTTCGTRVLAKPSLADKCGPGTTGTPPNCVSTDAKKAAADAAQQAKDAAAQKALSDAAAKAKADAAAKSAADAAQKAAADAAKQKAASEAAQKAAADTAKQAADAAKQKAAAEAAQKTAADAAKQAADAAKQKAAAEAAQKAAADAAKQAADAAKQKAAAEAAQKAAAEAARQRAVAEAERQRRAADAEAKRRADEAAGKAKAAQEAARQRAEQEAKRRATEAAANAAKKPSCPQGQVFKDGRCQKAP